MFDELPETIPHKNKRKLEAFATAFGLQIVLVAVLIIVQMAMPEKLGQFQLLETLYMAPPPPPPAAPLSAAPEPVRHAAGKAEVNPSAAVVQEQPLAVVEKPQVIAPTAIPRDISRIVEAGPAGGGVNGGVPGGVPGGVVGGIGGGVLGGVLGGAATAPNVPPPHSVEVLVAPTVNVANAFSVLVCSCGWVLMASVPACT